MVLHTETGALPAHLLSFDRESSAFLGCSVRLGLASMALLDVYEANETLQFERPLAETVPSLPQSSILAEGIIATKKPESWSFSMQFVESDPRLEYGSAAFLCALRFKVAKCAVEASCLMGGRTPLNMIANHNFAKSAAAAKRRQNPRTSIQTLEQGLQLLNQVQALSAARKPEYEIVVDTNTPHGNWRNAWREILGVAA